MATTARTSTNSSREDCVDEAGRNTSTLAGDATAKSSEKQPTMPTSSQTRSKRSMELAFSSDSNTSVTSSLSKYAEKKSKKKVPTENHLKLRAAVDATRKWELDLEEVHGLTDEQACVCVSNLAPYLKKEAFPSSNGGRMMELAEEGWKLMKELHRLMDLYPECGDQTSINGEWTML